MNRHSLDIVDIECYQFSARNSFNSILSIQLNCYWYGKLVYALMPDILYNCDFCCVFFLSSASRSTLESETNYDWEKKESYR